MKVLIVKLSSLGDVVHAMPAVQDIRRALPQAQIDWVVERGFAPLVRRCAGVNRVIECELRRWCKSPFSTDTGREWRAFKTELQRERYDAVIDLQGLTKSALVSWLAVLAPGGKRYALGNQTEGSGYEAPTRWVADVALELAPHIHAVQRSRELCARALGYTMPDSECFGLVAHEGRVYTAIENIASQGARTAGCVALVHGTSRADKQWPLQHWVALGRRLNDRGYTVALAHGSDEEKRRSEDIARQLADAVVWPRLGLDALTDALADCTGVVGVDSGLSHIAVALDLPHVQIYNFDTAWRTGPVARPHQRSVFANPAPPVETVWQAWLAVSGVNGGQIPIQDNHHAGDCSVERNWALTPINAVPGEKQDPMRLLYSCLMWLIQPLLRRKLIKRGAQEPGYLEALEERFGHYTTGPWAPGENCIWVHAVSLGETRAAAVLIARLRERLPGMRLLLTHGTATGRAEGAILLQAGDFQTWQPWDTPAAVQRFLAHFRPRIGILMETEVWPNLAAVCARSSVPLVLANARLSRKSLKKARWLSWLSRPAYRSLAAVWAQTQDDAARFAALGAHVQGVFGNLKFDATPDVAKLEAGKAWRAAGGRPVIMFASSREGEEALLLECLKRNRTETRVERSSYAIEIVANDIQWLIVPRHPQRFDEVAALIGQHGFAVSRRSGWGDAPPATTGAGDVRPTLWLGDSLGDMPLYYGLADVALLGGSFAPLGGQNLIEAAACGCPVVMGPHTFNFDEAAALAEAAGAARRMESLDQAVAAAQALVHEPVAQAAMVAAATRFAQAHRGAVDKTAAAVVALLRQQGVDAL